MTTAVANYDEFNLKRFLVYSLCLHAALVLSVAASIYFNFRGNPWAGVGGDLGGTKVNLVSSAGIPMPSEPVVTESKTVDPTKGLYKEEPPKPPEPKTDATKIPKFEKEKPLPPTHKSKVFEDKTPPPPNAVPYGAGGNPRLPTGYSQTPGGSSGVSIQGQGGADFATRYGWYIAAVKRRIDPNWDRFSIDASVRSSNTLHCAVSFTISRDGSVKNVRISESSGNLSWDNSGIRAVLSSNPLPALPSDYSGSSVDVIWDFPQPGK
jgi:TonB family protein